MSFLFFVLLCLLLASAAVAAKNDVCPPIGQTPNLAGVAGQFVFLRQKSACPTADDYDSIKVSAACRQAQADLYKSNPALQTAMEKYIQNVQQPLAQAFDKNQDVNFNAAQIPGHAEFKAQCQKVGSTAALVHHVEQNLSCGTQDYHFQLRNDLACVAAACSEAERNVDNIAVMKLLVSQAESKLGGSAVCGGGFADYTGYTWYMYLPMLLWVVFTGGCLLLAQKQKNLYGYN